MLPLWGMLLIWGMLSFWGMLPIWWMLPIRGMFVLVMLKFLINRVTVEEPCSLQHRVGTEIILSE